MNPYPHVFRPGRIGALEVPNRIVMPPMATNYATSDGMMTGRQIAYYLERARGGVGYITFEHTAVAPEGRATPNMAMIASDDHLPGFIQLVKAIHQAGGKIVIQINHAGRGTTSAVTGLPVVGPSPIPCPVRKEVPRELDHKGIQEIVQAFVRAAGRVKASGADGIEIHMAHGYLIAQFLSPFSNQRSDAYGGTPERRMRLALEVLRAVRERVGPDFPVICRFSGDEYVAGGLKIEDTQRIAQALEENGADALHVSACVAASGHLLQPSYYVPEGVFVPLAKAIKSVVKIPVITVGRIRRGEHAEEILREGKADFVAMGRALIADPHLPAKLREGKEEEILPCISCNRCSVTGRAGNLQCAVNPRVGRESTFLLEKAAKSKKVWVIGGGPAGMKAAEIASRRGHEVTLFEKKHQLGGRFVLAALPPEKEILGEFIDSQRRRVKRLPIQFMLGRAFDPTVLNGKEKPEAVIVATGARPSLERIEGIQGRKGVFTGDEALSSPRSLGEEVLVLGGGGVGAEIADFLSELGKAVTLIEMQEGIALDLPPHSRIFLEERLEEKEVEVLTLTRVVRLDPEGLWVEGPQGKRVLREFDSIVVAMGTVPNDEMVAGIREKIPATYVVGDAAKPREIMEALAEAEEVALRI
jgi:2,4-dienoyl-CoA reductase-like NADH-dependent reductase (Old Yellow Enzyme family)/thioredoxin reductase